jgi:HSP20 family protein
MAGIVRRSDVEPSLTRWDPQRWDPFEIMRDLTTWDPFQGLGRAFVPLAGQRVFVPTFDVRETADSYVFMADLPGVNEDDIDISLTGNRITISGEREVEEKHEGETYYAAERSYGRFSRTFTVPEGCDLDHVKADLKNGVLTVVVPKHEAIKPKRISLKGLKEGVKESVEGLKEKVSEKMEKISEKMKS